jgi:hypothetical protein
MMTACLLLLSVVQAASDGNLSSLVCVDSHAQQAGTMHIIVRNDSGQTLTLHPREIFPRESTASLPVWWMQATPETLIPGAFGEIAFSVKRPTELQGGYRCSFAEGNWEFYMKTGERPAIDVVHMVLDPASGDIFTFLQNTGSDALEISGVRIDGLTVDLAPECRGRMVAPGAIAMVYGSLPFPQTASTPVQHIVAQIDTPAGSCHRHALLFRGPVFSLGTEESEANVFQCPTHRHGPWDTVGDALFSHATAGNSIIPTVHFCRNRFPEGLAAFGQCLPRALVNIQSADLERGTPQAWQALNTLAPTIGPAVQPGIFAAILEPHSVAEGSYIQPPDKSAPTLPARELRHLACLAIANGAKGILFRMGESPHPDFKEMTEALSRELGRITPLLGISGVVTLPVSCSDPAVSTATLACGRNTHLVILTRSNLAQSKPPTPLTASVTLPSGVEATHWMEVGGSWKAAALTPPTSTVTMALDKFEDDALLLVTRQ